MVGRGHGPTCLLCHEGQRQSVWVEPANRFESPSSADDLPICESTESSEPLLYPIKFREGPDVAGKHPDPKSLLSLMNGVAIRPPEVQQHRPGHAAGEHRELVSTLYLLHVHHILVERRRAVEVFDTDHNGPD